MSITVDFIDCPNCGDNQATQETDNTGRVEIFCTCCGYNTFDKENVCPRCSAGLSYDTIMDNGVIDANGNSLISYKTICMNENCDYEGYAIFKMKFVYHNDHAIEE
ncbi:MAG: hypothetical protein J7L15_08265 [Clostridiales bacterium]|nr:hypothetical protein [Clostridiales bacterium]